MFLHQNIKYPQLAREYGIRGTVHITFVVEPDGSISLILRTLHGENQFINVQ